MSATAKPSRLSGPTYPFSQEEAGAASKAWGCNCGPGALAAILGMKPDDVRPHIPNFDARRYTNPSMMGAALRSLGVTWRDVDDAGDREGKEHALPDYGLVRVQWLGPWMNPQPGRERWALMDQYRHTHWIATALFPRTALRIPTRYVFDINFGWAPLDWWQADPFFGDSMQVANNASGKIANAGFVEASVWVRCTSFSGGSSDEWQCGVILEEYSDAALTNRIGRAEQFPLRSSGTAGWNRITTSMVAGAYVRMVVRAVATAAAVIEIDNASWNLEEAE